jgi:hypothetical protein
MELKFILLHGRMGVILFGGGAQYSLPEQANLTLIFFPWGEEVTKKFFPDIPKNIFPDISANILQNFFET